MKYYLWFIAILLTLTSVTALNYSQLKEYYTFDDLDSLEGLMSHDLVNYSLANNNGIFVSGKFDNALEFSNGTAYKAYINFDEYQSISINFWIRFPKNTTTQYMTLSSNPLYSNSFTYNHFILGVTNSSNSRLIINYHTTYSQAYYLGYYFNDLETNFHMVTYVWNNSIGNLKIYYDGILNDTITGYTYVGEYTPNMDYLILGYYIPTTTYANGNFTLDEYTLWNTLLSQSDINELYNITEALNTTNISEVTNYSYLEYPCLNSSNDGIGTDNLCLGYAYLYDNGSLECHGYGLTDVLNCSLGCTYYDDIVGGFCNVNDTLLNANETTSLDSATFSKNQCIYDVNPNIPNQDYLCNDTRMDSNLNILCNYDSIIPCSKYCNTVVSNLNLSSVEYFSGSKSCDEINEGYIAGIDFKCTLYWFTPNFWFNAVLFSHLGKQPCTDKLFGIEYIPPNHCNDSWSSINQYYQQHTQDTLYFEGQCANSTCISTCSLDDNASCANNIQTKTCILYPDGCYRYNYSTCSSGKICDNGLCRVGIIDDGTGHGGSNCDDSKFWNACELDDGILYLVVLALVLVTIVGFIVVGYTIKMIQASFVVGVVIAVFEIIIFTLIGWIPAWILIILILLAIATIILVARLPSNNSTG